jgi:hypothetical protein
MTDHAAASPSSATMWLNCPASITLAEGRTRPSSRYAKEGTAAHTISEMILGGDMLPPGKLTVEGTEFITGMEMLRNIRPYLDYVLHLADVADEIHYETRVHIDDLVWGTSDCAARTGTILDIADLKYGKGVHVEPDSAQLRIYALAAANTLWPDHLIEHVNLTIVQPRMDPEPKSFYLSAEELWAWKENVLMPAIDRITMGDTTEKAGSWCRWCIRKSECAAFASHKSSIAAEIFDDGVDLADEV